MRSLGSPIFIGGAGRSGTSLVRVILEAHPSISCGPEFKILPEVARLHQMMVGPLEAQMQAYGNGREDVVRELRSLVLGLVEPFLAASGKPRWAEKTPHNVAFMVSLGELFPEAKFIHVIRDGRDVAASLVTMEWYGLDGQKSEYTRDIARAAGYWRWLVETARTQTRHPSLAGRVAELPYESIVKEPEETLRQVFDYLDEPWDERVLKYYQNRPEGEIRESSTDQVSRPLYSTAVGRWRRDMTVEDKRVFKSVAGALLCELGYADDLNW